MATIFSRIISGELPGTFVWRDDESVAFLSINPIRPGHTLVVPIAEVDHWTDLEPELAEHLMRVSQRIGQAQRQAFEPARVGLVIAGFEVPHCHVHVIPTRGMQDFDFANAAADPDPDQIARSALELRAALRDAGHGQFVSD
jgi:histidine triad (HIT) family protein